MNSLNVFHLIRVNVTAGCVGAALMLAPAALGQGDLFGGGGGGGFDNLQQAPPKFNATIPDYNPADAVDLGDGLMIVDLVVGDGAEVTDGTLVITHYNGWLAKNEHLFESSHNPGKARYARMIPSPGRIIEGWNRGLLGMRVGGKRLLKVPAALAYAEYGFPRLGVPPNSDLVFEVDLIDTVSDVTLTEQSAQKHEDDLLYKDLRIGEGTAFRKDGIASFHYAVWDQGGEFRGSSYTTTHGRPMTVGVQSQSKWLEYVRGMKPGGRRVTQFHQEKPIPPDVYKKAMDAGEKLVPEVETWTLIVDAVDIMEPLVIPPHDAAKEIDLGDGLIAVDLRVGDGDEIPKYGVAFVDYTAWLADGQVFDSTQIPGKEPRFIAKGLDVPALELGLKGMKVGGKRKLIVPSALGYGEDGSRQMRVPENADLVYVLELRSWEMPLFTPVDDLEDGWGEGELKIDVEGLEAEQEAKREVKEKAKGNGGITGKIKKSGGGN
ncbi:MAG: hypothetical protein D8M59_05705 [Planctomycetes bacterium]|nr:hypothetical protein [Planctomycetota bacterium]NOG55923.1 hypothetical protein [Planctomycetota bacterium]